jgi:hypothetical protein
MRKTSQIFFCCDQQGYFSFENWPANKKVCPPLIYHHTVYSKHSPLLLGKFWLVLVDFDVIIFSHKCKVFSFFYESNNFFALFLCFKFTFPFLMEKPNLIIKFLIGLSPFTLPPPPQFISVYFLRKGKIENFSNIDVGSNL